MAIPNNQAIMVLRQEDTATSTVPQTSACSLFVVVNQLHPAGGGQDKQTVLASVEASPLTKPTIGSCVPSFNKVSSMSVMAATNTSNQLCNLPAESTCKGITVTLDNNNMWKEFFRCQTEMILTKQGRRMFPCCRFHISGLEPFQRYTLIMDMQPVDNYRYKWSDRRWETNGKADLHVLSSFVHPDSPATGFDWMQNPVSFYKLKLTNNPLDRDGHIVINSMHRYIPCLHIIPADNAVDAIQLDGPDVVTFSFSQTEFFAVTAYQNLSITQLKIDYNPFAKGFRDDANNSRCCKPKSVSSAVKLESEAKPSTEASALNNLKSLFAKMNASEKVSTIVDHKTVNCEGPRKVESECSSNSMKRPWPGGLSDLIKGAHVKVKRISLEKIPNGSSQQMNIDSLAPKEKDSLSENISIPDVTMEVKEIVSFSKNTDSSTLKNTTESFSAANIPGKLNTSTTPLNEKRSAVLGETTTLTDEKLSSEKTSKSVVKPLDCGGEVKKKRAEPVPLPLLALFLQQLKSKTRPPRKKTKSDACSLPSESDKSCQDISVAEDLASSTVTLIPPLNTQLNVQPIASLTSQTITSSSLTCTVVNADDETVSTPDSAIDAVTASAMGIVCDALQLPTPKNVSAATTSLFAHEDNPNTTLLDTTPDTKTVSVTLDDNSSDCVLNCDPKAFPHMTPDAPNNELVHSTVKSGTEPSNDSCTFPSPEPVPEAVPQSPSLGDKTPSSPSCVPSPPYGSAPSSPDPFPPSMFHNRPIPPRKALDPFPPCLSLYRPRPLLEIANPLPQTFFTPPPRDPGPPVGVRSEVNCPAVSHEPDIPKEIKRPITTSKGKKAKVNQKKGNKSKLSEDTEVKGGPIPVPLQPNLEDVEGQLFVSFMSKKALEIHLGDETKEEDLQKTPQNIGGKVHNEQKSIDSLEADLLQDLKNMKYRQVIHPVLQAVGLKLNLLDVTLSIDLQYLGVCLPIPPPILLPEGSSGTCSSQVHYVSRTGKTTDITKIKGWREKFSATSSSSVSGVTTSLDTGQKNLSAFCSDMLDEYLESEGKLIDERAASFSQAVVSPVAYQLPTKSTSYVRTLDSVLKKQQLPIAVALSKKSATSKKTALNLQSKKPVSGVKQGTKKSVKKKENPVARTDGNAEGSSSKKSTKSNTPKSVSTVLSADPNLSESKKSPKIKTKKGSKTSQNSLQTAEKSVKDGASASPARQTSSSPGSNLPVGRSSGLPKTLVKLRDVEDGAVWEGKNRTYITMERAAIALSCLVTAEGTIGGSPATVIKRRAPPCLNDFCRLGCVCASLVQERRQHHCGKPHCMLGCDCLRRKVVLLKKEDTDNGFVPANNAEENEPKIKKKKRISYILSGPDSAPEPALHVKTLWVKQINADSEQLYIPDVASPLPSPPVSLDLQKDLENFLHPSPKRGAIKAVDGEWLSRVKNQESLDCARVRPFCGRKLSPCGQRRMKECHPDLVSQDSLQEIEEGELRPPTQSGPTKRLEIVSKCKWATEGSRNVVLRTVCERMAQDRLTDIFWIGKYQVQPTSKTTMETDEGSIITYKVFISQPHLEESEEKKNEERIKQLEARLIETIGKSEVKGLPLLSKVTPAGLLRAEKKPSGALGQIMVNGKLYPQAKLELGQMGALHPANRLAAYITGRVCVANKRDVKTDTTVTKPSHATSPNTASVAMTTVSNTLSSPVTLDKPTVAKQPMGKEFVQVELDSRISQQQKTTSAGILPVQSTVKNLIVSPSCMLAGSSESSASSNMPPKARMVSHASPASGTTDGSIHVVTAVPKDQKTFLFNSTGSNVALSGRGISLMQPSTSTRSVIPGQKMVMFKAANPANRLFRLVPLGQFRACNPNVLVHPQQSTFIRFPSPNPVPTSKPQTFTTVTSSSAPSLATQTQNMSPVYSRTKNTVTTSSTSAISPKPVTPLSSSKTILLCNKPNTVKIIPVLLKDNSTGTLKFLPQKVSEKPQILKTPKISSSTSSTQRSSEGHPTNQGLQLTSQSCLINKADPQKLDNPLNTSSTPAKKPSEEDSLCSKMLPENVVFTDHSYTFEMNKTRTPSEKPVDVSKDCSDPANSSTYHMLLKEVLDMGLVEQAEGCGTSEAVLSTESGDESNAGSEEEIDSDSTDLTEDSDMYNDTDSSQSSDEETDRQEKKKKQGSFGSEMKDLTEKDDDELVDIETFEEGTEKNPALSKKHDHCRNQSSDEENEDKNVFKVRKRKDEKKRRIALSNCFYNLQQTLNMECIKVPKIVLLSKALKEIHSLTKQRDHLVKTWDKMRQKRAYYIEMASQLSGKNNASISQKLDEIIAKQKSLESKDKNTNPDLQKSVCKDSQQTINIKQKKMRTKAEHLRISKQKHLRFQEQRNINNNPEETAANHGQPAEPPNSQPTSQLPKSPSLGSSPPERTRPNILSCNKTQTLDEDQVLVPQEISVVETVVPCNQIFTISNPFQPVDISSSGERHSTTPGVASVSISIPAIGRPLCAENPLPILQPQVLNLTSTPDNISVPKISSAASLVQSETLPVSLMQTQEPCKSSDGKAQHHFFSDEVVEEKKQLDQQLSEFVPKKHDSEVRMEENPKNQEGGEENIPNLEQDDRLMSLLDELVFLNQASESQGEAPTLTEEGDVLTELLTNKETDMDRDDERSLSPLFLKLDEDLITSPTSKDEEIDDIPPKVDDLVKVIFGSDLAPSNCSDLETVAAACDNGTRVSVCNVKYDAPTPPPLLQMKSGGCTTTDSQKEQVNLSWRPMPKLAPLGLKTQETGHPKLISSHAPKSDSNLPSLHNAHE